MEIDALILTVKLAWCQALEAELMRASHSHSHWVALVCSVSFITHAEEQTTIYKHFPTAPWQTWSDPMTHLWDVMVFSLKTQNVLWIEKLLMWRLFWRFLWRPNQISACRALKLVAKKSVECVLDVLWPVCGVSSGKCTVDYVDAMKLGNVLVIASLVRP